MFINRNMQKNEDDLFEYRKILFNFFFIICKTQYLEQNFNL